MKYVYKYIQGVFLWQDGSMPSRCCRHYSYHAEDTVHDTKPSHILLTSIDSIVSLLRPLSNEHHKSSQFKGKRNFLSKSFPQDLR